MPLECVMCTVQLIDIRSKLAIKHLTHSKSAVFGKLLLKIIYHNYSLLFTKVTYYNYSLLQKVVTYFSITFF